MRVQPRSGTTVSSLEVVEDLEGCVPSAQLDPPSSPISRGGSGEGVRVKSAGGAQSGMSWAAAHSGAAIYFVRFGNGVSPGPESPCACKTVVEDSVLLVTRPEPGLSLFPSEPNRSAD